MLLLALLLSLNSFAQNFPGERVELLKGKTIKVTPFDSEVRSKMGYYGFYKDAALEKIYKKSGNGTPVNELVGKEFKVVSIQPFVTALKENLYKLLLENAETGNLYYKYNPQQSASFPFEVVGGLEVPSDFYKDYVKRDLIEGVHVTQTKNMESIEFKSFKMPSGTVFSGYINRPYSDSPGEGATITFKDNSKIEKPEAVLEKYQSGNTIYFKAKFYLTAEECNKLTNNEIISVKAGNVEKNIKDGSLIKGVFKYFNIVGQ